VKLAIIAAIARNRVIGKAGALPWHISEDLKRFKRLTTGHAVLMGRRTFESIGEPLPNRRNVVVTSRHIPGLETYPSIESALDALKDQELVFVIGGGRVYSQLLDRVDELYLTLVERDVDGDTLFPPYEELLRRSFTPVVREQHDGFVFIDFVRAHKS
jgi:dihydrofolate reductase